jgi:hypothetical protein
MTTSRRILIASALALGLAAAAAIAAFALSRAPEPAVKPAYVTSHGLRARAVVGTYCAPSGNDAIGCADKVYPLHPRAYLPITPGSRLRVNLRRHAKGLDVVLLRVEGNEMKSVGGKVRAKRSGGNGRFWRLRLPDDLGGANALSIGADLKPSGDANWWAGVKPVEQWP